MRFDLYARASTRDKQNPEHQLAELRDWCARHGHTVGREVIERESGRKDDRPEWQSLLGSVLAGGADGIAAVELSRFGRSLPHLLQVSKALEAAGRQLVCTRQPIDTTSPVGRLIFSVLGAVAEFEADLTRERVTAGVRHARAEIEARGLTWGRQREKVQPEALELAALWRSQGESWRDISAQLAQQGLQQPARWQMGKLLRPERPWPIGTLRDAVARVEIPPSKPGG